jgi:hypothetical protein
MKLVGMLSTALLVAAPAMACAQAHGGMAGGAGRSGFSQASTAHGSASWGPGFGPASAGHGAGHGGRFHGGRGSDRHDGGFHDRFHDHNHGVWLGWGPYWGWGWPDCGAYGDACDWGDESGPGAPSDDYGFTDAGYPETPSPDDAACGAWLRHGAGYAWTRRACGDPPAADPPAHAAVAAKECGDWVWRADLHRSICKRPAHAAG